MDYKMFTEYGNHLVDAMINEAIHGVPGQEELSARLRDGIKALHGAGQHEVIHDVVREKIRARINSLGYLTIEV